MTTAIAALRGFIDVDDRPFEQGLKRAERRPRRRVDRRERRRRGAEPAFPGCQLIGQQQTFKTSLPKVCL
jgi:hypothetical protein